MMMKIDMSPEAVTSCMIALDQLWELAVALKSSEIVKDQPVNQADVELLPQKNQHERA